MHDNLMRKHHLKNSVTFRGVIIEPILPSTRRQVGNVVLWFPRMVPCEVRPPIRHQQRLFLLHSICE